MLKVVWDKKLFKLSFFSDYMWQILMIVFSRHIADKKYAPESMKPSWFALFIGTSKKNFIKVFSYREKNLYTSYFRFRTWLS